VTDGPAETIRIGLKINPNGITKNRTHNSLLILSYGQNFEGTKLRLICFHPDLFMAIHGEVTTKYSIDVTTKFLSTDECML
jgi:hypothetical protein